MFLNSQAVKAKSTDKSLKYIIFLSQCPFIKEIKPVNLLPVSKLETDIYYTN